MWKWGVKSFTQLHPLKTAMSLGEGGEGFCRGRAKGVEMRDQSKYLLHGQRLDLCLNMDSEFPSYIFGAG